MINNLVRMDFLTPLMSADSLRPSCSAISAVTTLPALTDCEVSLPRQQGVVLVRMHFGMHFRKKNKPSFTKWYYL
jgi:hypothetical protein